VLIKFIDKPISNYNTTGIINRKNKLCIGPAKYAFIIGNLRLNPPFCLEELTNSLSSRSSSSFTAKKSAAAISLQQEQCFVRNFVNQQNILA